MLASSANAPISTGLKSQWGRDSSTQRSFDRSRQRAVSGTPIAVSEFAVVKKNPAMRGFSSQS
jgi:hypothetical protein